MKVNNNFLCTFNKDISNKLISLNAKLIKEVQMNNKQMYMFLYDEEIYKFCNSKFDAKDIFISDRYYT